MSTVKWSERLGVRVAPIVGMYVLYAMHQVWMEWLVFDDELRHEG